MSPNSWRYKGVLYLFVQQLQTDEMQILQGTDLAGADQLAGAGDDVHGIGVGVQIAEDGSVQYVQQNMLETAQVSAPYTIDLKWVFGTSLQKINSRARKQTKVSAKALFRHNICICVYKDGFHGNKW